MTLDISEIEDRLDDLESRIDEHHDEYESRIDDFAERYDVEELESRIDELEVIQQQTLLNEARLEVLLKGIGKIFTNEEFRMYIQEED